MATLTKGQTFASGDTVTATKLNNLVDAATIANIVNADIGASAAIAHSKLANITAGQVLLGNASNAPTATALSGDVTVNSSGVTAIGSGVIVDADINASAAIGLSKLATGALPTAITVASANLVDGTIVNADINASAAIAHTKLANITAGQVLMGNASNAPTATALSGDVTINSSGVTAIGSGVIVDADVSASAGIAHSKLANITAGQVLMGNATNVPTSTALSGDVTVNSSGVTAIGAGVIVDADVNASAAISLSKLATGALPSAITVASANIVDGTIVNADISGSAAIDHSKLAHITAGSVLIGNATNVPTATAVTGDVTISSSGVTAIGSGVIVNADISASAAIDGSKLATAAQQALVPAGAVMAFAMNSAPSGWLAADGSNVNRTTYASLFSAIGTTYGAGDGSTTFDLPDLRGYFVRGSGTNSDATAAGTFGAKQADDLKSHLHTHEPGAAAGAASGGSFTAQRTDLLTTAINTSSTGGTETRPKNIAMLYCIKF
jgi:microcystin-dependent protein/sporulation protein YlmC with PRC-barrel domain